ncbi:unnamed protein product [Closterium sp. Yama58-4]|nr:unnamed protein product [Closterium sp. Yama58-4]
MKTFALLSDLVLLCAMLAITATPVADANAVSESDPAPAVFERRFPALISGDRRILTDDKHDDHKDDHRDGKHDDHHDDHHHDNKHDKNKDNDDEPTCMEKYKKRYAECDKDEKKCEDKAECNDDKDTCEKKSKACEVKAYRSFKACKYGKWDCTDWCEYYRRQCYSKKRGHCEDKYDDCKDDC